MVLKRKLILFLICSVASLKTPHVTFDSVSGPRPELNGDLPEDCDVQSYVGERLGFHRARINVLCGTKKITNLNEVGCEGPINLTILIDQPEKALMKAFADSDPPHHYDDIAHTVYKKIRRNGKPMQLFYRFVPEQRVSTQRGPGGLELTKRGKQQTNLTETTIRKQFSEQVGFTKEVENEEFTIELYTKNLADEARLESVLQMLDIYDRMAESPEIDAEDCHEFLSKWFAGKEARYKHCSQVYIDLENGFKLNLGLNITPPKSPNIHFARFLRYVKSSQYISIRRTDTYVYIFKFFSQCSDNRKVLKLAIDHILPDLEKLFPRSICLDRQGKRLTSPAVADEPKTKRTFEQEEVSSSSKRLKRS